MAWQNLLLALFLLPFAGAVTAATLGVHARNAEAWLSGAVMCAGLAILVALFPQVASGGVLVSTVEWLPALGLNVSLRLDGLAWLMLLLVFGIGLMVVIYARYYLSARDPVPRFYAFLLCFAGAMAGVLLSGNIIALVVLWELTSFLSFLLIGYWYQSPASRQGARTALVVTGGGGLCLLAAMLVMGQIAGSYELETVLAAGELIRGHPLYPLVLALFLLGAFTKSAQFPFHFWLPNAMAAPTPVSAYLHSATMVKAGVFLLVRFSPVLGGTSAWFWIVAGVGMTTLTLGAVTALYRNDLKGLLAYSTVSHLGLITALAGIGSGEAIIAAIFHIANHAVFKASLFMAAGIIDHETGTRDMRRLSGLFRVMPGTGVLAIVAAGAMGGVPLLNGFLSKEMFFAEAAGWHNGTVLDNALPYIAVFASIFTVAYSVRFIATVFFGPPPQGLPKTPHEPPTWMRRPVELLVLVVLLVGIFPALTVGSLLHAAALAVLGADVPAYSLAVWHGFTRPLAMSMVALVLGTLVYWLFADRLSKDNEGPPLLHRVRAQAIFDQLMLTLAWRWPRILHDLFGTTALQPQLRLVVLVSLAGGAWALWGAARLVPRGAFAGFNPAFALLWLAGGACAVGAAWTAKYHRFAALGLLGGAGLATSVTFAWLSAPDLATTQLLVEALTTVLLLLGLRWLPRRVQAIAADVLPPARLRRGRDLIIAAACGGGIAALAFAVMSVPAGTSIGDWFRRNAYAEGGGTNAVNVILVDFRAFDTLGEITVLAIVALTSYALLRRFRPAPESVARPRQQVASAAKAAPGTGLAVPAVIMQWMFPVLIALAAYLFVRGHDLPGGGFAAGVTFAIALLLQYLASGVRWIESRITVQPIRWMGLGLLISAGTGAGALLLGYPFLTMASLYLDLPLLGEVPVSATMLFDLGVLAVVLGGTVLIQIAIAHQSLRAARLRARGEAEAGAGVVPAPALAGEAAGWN